MWQSLKFEKNTLLLLQKACHRNFSIANSASFVYNSFFYKFSMENFQQLFFFVGGGDLKWNNTTSAPQFVLEVTYDTLRSVLGAGAYNIFTIIYTTLFNIAFLYEYFLSFIFLFFMLQFLQGRMWCKQKTKNKVLVLYSKR